MLLFAMVNNEFNSRRLGAPLHSSYTPDGSPTPLIGEIA